MMKDHRGSGDTSARTPLVFYFFSKHDNPLPDEPLRMAPMRFAVTWISLSVAVKLDVIVSQLSLRTIFSLNQLTKVKNHEV